MMISNKEKRLSQAHGEVFIIPDGHLVNNNIHPTNCGMINNNNNDHHHHHMNNLAMKDPHLRKLMNENRNSHSLNHDFQQLYISNLKNQIDSHTNVKRIEPNQPHLEEISSYKKEAMECKKRMFQMEKSISFWNECTEYWRNKWRKTRDEKNKLRDEVRQLKSRINKLEYQLQISDEKRLRLGNEVNLLNEELSRYMYRFEDDLGNNINSRSKMKQLHQPQHAVHYNSDRRVDYRKKHRRKKELSKDHIKLQPQLIFENQSSSSDSDSRAQPHSYTIQKDESLSSLSKLRNDQVQSSSSLGNPKVIFRHHERLFDKKIMNKKRFSQVVMLDEDEILQMNKEIPSTSRSTINNDTLKAINNDTLNTHTNRYRHMDYVPEDVEEEDSTFDDRIKPGQFFSDDLDFESTGGFVGDSSTNINIKNVENFSTIATNSECPNVGSISQNDNNDQNYQSNEEDQESSTPSLKVEESQDQKYEVENCEDQPSINRQETDDDDEV